MSTALRKPAPHPEPSTSPLAGGGVEGAGLTVVDGQHWSERLPSHRTAKWNDGWVLAIPVVGVAVGVTARFGWGYLLYLATAALALVILVSLAVERVEKVQKRHRRLARPGRVA